MTNLMPLFLRNTNFFRCFSIYGLFFCFLLCLLASCKIETTFVLNETDVDFKIEFSSFNKKNFNWQDEDTINTEEIKTAFESIDVKNVLVTAEKNIVISGTFEKKGKCPIVIAGIIEFFGKNEAKFIYSAKKLRHFYELLPFELQSYIDLIVAPAFTGEKMSSDEYLDLISSIYGNETADELKNGDVIIKMDTKNKKMSEKHIPLLEILNAK